MPPPLPKINFPPPQPSNPLQGFTLNGGGSGKSGYVGGNYEHKLWEGRNGARLDGNVNYGRSWPGPNQNHYGGGVKLTIPF